MPKPGFLGAAARGSTAQGNIFSCALRHELVAAAYSKLSKTFSLDWYQPEHRIPNRLKKESFSAHSQSHVPSSISVPRNTNGCSVPLRSKGRAIHGLSSEFFFRALRCIASQQAKNGRAGSSCARACGARSCSSGSLYGTTSQPSTPFRQAQGHLGLNAKVVP
jgi:hypothetical protein